MIIHSNCSAISTLLYYILSLLYWLEIRNLVYTHLHIESYNIHARAFSITRYFQWATSIIVLQMYLTQADGKIWIHKWSDMLSSILFTLHFFNSVSLFSSLVSICFAMSYFCVFQLQFRNFFCALSVQIQFKNNNYYINFVLADIYFEIEIDKAHTNTTYAVYLPYEEIRESTKTTHNTSS